MPTMFEGRLNSNEVFNSIYNQIISQQVAADNIKGTYSTLVDKFRVDGTLYGDTKLYYATDALVSSPWGGHGDAEANLFEQFRPADPKCQKITLDKFRQIRLTVDNYLSKRAWSTEGAFSSFTSVMLGWLKDTKRIYDSTIVNSFVGTTETEIGKQNRQVSAVEGQNDGLTMAVALANILVELKDVSRDFNNYGFIRSYDESDLMIIWNAEAYNQIQNAELPVVYHKAGLLGEFEQTILPARYFGRVNAAATKGREDGTVRSLIEQVIGSRHYFAGDSINIADTAPEGTSYTEDNTIAFKIIHKNSVPYMSAFEVSTVFVNPRNLTENHYLTFGHNTLDYLADKPFITVRFSEPIVSPVE